MTIITKIDPWIPKDSTEIKRYYINFQDGKKIWVHPNIFKKWNLKVNQDVDIEKLEHDNEFKWKNAYDNGSWKKEKIRLDAVKNFIESNRIDLNVDIVGFGAESTGVIYKHTEEQGSPDLSIKKNGEEVAKIEVSGSDIMRGSDYWIRPDKISYIKNHPEVKVWIILHYQSPVEKMVFININPEKEYHVVQKTIRENTEHYVVFNDNSPEVVSEREFLKELRLW